MTEATDSALTLYVALGRLVRSVRQDDHTGSPVGPGGTSAMFTLSRASGPLRLGALAEAEGITAPSLTRIVNALEELGLVVRQPDPSDGRAQVVSLTARGSELISSGLESRVASVRARMAALDPEMRRRLEAALPAFEALAAVPAIDAQV